MRALGPRHGHPGEEWRRRGRGPASSTASSESARFCYASTRRAILSAAVAFRRLADEPGLDAFERTSYGSEFAAEPRAVIERASAPRQAVPPALDTPGRASSNGQRAEEAAELEHPANDRLRVGQDERAGALLKLLRRNHDHPNAGAREIVELAQIENDVGRVR